MDPKIVDLLEKLGTKVSTTGARAFEIAVKGAYANALVGVSVGILGAFLVILGTWRILSIFRGKDNSDYALAQFVLSIFFGLVGCIFCIIGLSFVSDLLAPEWAALRNLAQFVR
jgi:hypothetical protein